MARPRERVCLEQGLKLDLVQLARSGIIRFGANVGPRGIRWNDRMSGDVFASGIITADMSGSEFGWLWDTYDRLIDKYLKYDAVLGGVPFQHISKT
jgi:hypothetical protein